MTTKLIKPHGGKLINREFTGEEREKLLKKAALLPVIRLNAREISDLELIANGAFSPLEGFLNEADYHSVIEQMRLANGTPWSIPVTLSVSQTEAAHLIEGEDIA